MNNEVGVIALISANRLLGRKIFVYEESSEVAIAETVIEELELAQMIIKVKSDVLYQRNTGKVTVLVLTENAIYEFNGTLRRSHYGMCEIALYQGKEREKRLSKRFAVESDACVDTLLSGDRAIPLKKPILMRVLNISTSGARLQAAPKMLYTGACFQLRMNIGQNETVINSTIVWVREISPELWEYGCTFNELSQ